METKTETVEQRLLKTLRELTAPHAISPEGAAAIKPLIPLAEQVRQAALEREDRIAALEETLKHAGSDDAALRTALEEERAVTKQIKETLEGLQAQYDATSERLGAEHMRCRQLEEENATLRQKLEQAPKPTDFSDVKRPVMLGADFGTEDAPMDPEPTPNPDVVYENERGNLDAKAPPPEVTKKGKKGRG